MQSRVSRELCHPQTASSRPSTGSLWSTLRKRLAKTRCRMFHRYISLPVKGKYRCWTCLKEYDTDW